MSTNVWDSFNTGLLSCVHVVLHRQVWRAAHQASGDEGVVHSYDQQRDDVVNKKGGHGVDLGVQFPGVGIGGAGDEGLVGGADGEGVEVGVDGLRDGQEQGEDPDEGSPQDNSGSGAWCLYVQGLHYGPVPDGWERRFYIQEGTWLDADTINICQIMRL